ncbi:pyrroloquinoline quinone biosynthesis protein PqqE [Sedimenticola hydrogenitrophicus]|uniref:pyrroloquinoline quinone biosynthesis protein PqqE n=1 Tax=Sedimenticola hydrogenitrophicus TaxID=2967975 RepID=UPI0021A46620
MAKAGSKLKIDGNGKPLWLVLELTYRCPLKCPWCNNPLDFDELKNELTTEEWKKVLRDARAIGSLQLGFSGGEPMLRPDLEELVDEGNRLGYYTNLITSGMGLSKDRLSELKRCGLKQIQLSLQHSNREKNDIMVGVQSHDEKMAVIEEIKAQGFPVVLNVPLSRYNIEAVDDIIDMAARTGVEYIEFANIQYYNWALLNRAALLPTREQIEYAEARVNEARKRLGNKPTIYFVVPDYFDGRPKACMNGWGAIHLTIAPDGSALPCQEAQVMEGVDFPNVRDNDLGWIWRESPAFEMYRGDAWMKKPCVDCDEKEKDFGGCRCQAYLLTGDATNTDPACSKSRHFDIIQSAVAAARITSGPQMPLVMRSRGAINGKMRLIRP